jgi:hypothetical protein
MNRLELRNRRCTINETADRIIGGGSQWRSAGQRADQRGQSPRIVSRADWSGRGSVFLT